MDKSGSTRFLEEMGVRSTFGERDLKAMLSIREVANAKLIDWCQYGQPGPDGVCGTFQVPVSSAIKLFERLIVLNQLRISFEVFPYGIPVPDFFTVRFQAGRLAQR